MKRTSNGLQSLASFDEISSVHEQNIRGASEHLAPGVYCKCAIDLLAQYVKQVCPSSVFYFEE